MTTMIASGIIHPEFDGLQRSEFQSNAVQAAEPDEQPVILWKFQARPAKNSAGTPRSTGLGDSAVADGIVYVGDDEGRLCALHATDGKLAWEYEHGSRISCTPGLDQNHVYFGSPKGITALDRKQGELVWTHSIAAGANETTPISINGRVYVSGYDGYSYALEAATGNVLWTHDFSSDAPPDPPEFDGKRARFDGAAARPRGAACDGKLFVVCVFDQSRAIALDCATGERRWSCSTGGWPGDGPTLAKDRVLVPSQDKHVYCLNRDTGAVVWKYRAPNWLGSNVAVRNNTVYISNHGGKLIQVSLESGGELRRFQTTDQADHQALAGGTPLVVDQTAYFCSSRGQIYAVDVSTNQLKWKLRPSAGSGIYSDPAYDGQTSFRMFITCRTDDSLGEDAVIAIGYGQ